ncbi:MAG: SOS response-associated peptidase family protein [Sphingomonadales bacterium]
MEMVDANWGSDPRFGDGVTFRFVRAETGDLSARRCLIPASEFHMGSGRKRYRAMLDGGNFFYLAGIWEPALAGWPLSYRIITASANADIAPYQDRHGAIIHRRQVMQWFDGSIDAQALQAPLLANTFAVEKIGMTRSKKPLLL